MEVSEAFLMFPYLSEFLMLGWVVGRAFLQVAVWLE